MTPAQPPLPTPWNLPFQELAGSHTSTLMSESDVGLIVTATRQKSGRSLYGLAPRPAACCAPGGRNWPAGTTCAIVTVVSFNLSAARLSHEEPNEGTANEDTNIHNVHLMVEIFIGE